MCLLCVYFVLETNYAFSLGQHFREFLYRRLFFWLYKVNGKILWIWEIGPIGNNVKTEHRLGRGGQKLSLPTDIEKFSKLFIITFSHIWYMVIECSSYELHFFSHIMHIAFLKCCLYFLIFLFKELLFSLNSIRF